MKGLLIAFIVVLLLYTSSWAEDTTPPPASSDQLKVEDLPKPILDLLAQLQRLSREIEPQITELGSKLGQELDHTVKKLKEELQSQRRRQSNNAALTRMSVEYLPRSLSSSGNRIVCGIEMYEDRI